MPVQYAAICLIQYTVRSIKACVALRMSQSEWTTVEQFWRTSDALANRTFLLWATILGALLYGLNLERADFPYWVMLYNIDLMHFQLLSCADLNVDVERTSVFAAADVPLALREHWNLCNERHFGYASQGGVS